MPEGPEVRTVADKLRPVITNKTIINSYVGPRAKTLGMFNLQCPATIINVRSHGKKLIIDLNTQHVIIISLGMAGRIQYSPGNHSHVRFDIADIEINGPLRIIKQPFSLYFDDSRYMGGVDIIPNSGLPLYFKSIGPDLLQAALDESTWIPSNMWLQIYTAKPLQKRAICQVLMDQSLISSIGNYLKAEILYYSGIHPDRSVETINLQEWETLRINAHKVIRLAYYYRGFTIHSFISPDGEFGVYPSAVYGKSHDPLGNQVIKSQTRDGRTTHWVPSLQR